MHSLNPAAQRDSTVSTIQLRPHQTIVVPLRSKMRVTAVEGSVLLSFVDPTLDWLGAAAPTTQRRLDEGDAHVAARSCHARLSGVSAGIAVVHFESIAAGTLFSRLHAWFSRGARPGKTADKARSRPRADRTGIPGIRNE